MKTPMSSRYINKEWVCFVVEEHLKKQNSNTIPKIDIKDFSIDKGAKANDSFNSELVTLDVIASLSEGDDAENSPREVQYHFMVKFLSTDFTNKFMNKKFNGSLKEYTIYSEYMQVLNNFQSSFSTDEYHINTPDLIYGKHSDSEFVLVMENIKYAGYENNDKYKGLDVTLLKEAVIQLARVHALSYAHSKTDPLLKKYPFFEVQPDAIRMITLFMRCIFDSGTTVLRMKKDREELAKKFETSKERVIAKFMTYAEHLNPDIPYCLTHGDYWNGNIMYKFEKHNTNTDETEMKIKCQIVDWGNSGFGSPIFDLHYLMHTSTTAEIRREHLQTILQSYHAAFTEITTAAGTPVPSWTFEELLKEWQRTLVFGFIMGLMLSQGTLSKVNVFSKQEQNNSSIMDHSACFPIQSLLTGMKNAVAKTSLALLTTSFGHKLASNAISKQCRPIREEILSGSNEVMNKRLLDLLFEAEVNGLFDE